MLKQLGQFFRAFVLFGFSCLICSITLAQEPSLTPSDKSSKTEEIVVTASRTKNRPEDAPASITIITAEDIETSPFEKVEDILRNTSGINVNYHYTLNYVAGNRPVNIRGTGGYGERTLVLVDGIPQNNAYTGWVEWSQIPKESIERIEIVRGSASALYGSNAMGGVINIITKKPTQPRETVLQQKYGSMNTYLTKLGQSGKSGKFSYSLNGEYEETDGYIGTEPRQSYDIKKFRKEERILTRFIYELDENSAVSLGWSHFYAKKGGGREYMYGYTENNRLSLNWSSDGKNIDWLATLRLNDDEWINLYDTAPYTYLYRKETIPAIGIGGSIQSTINLSNQHTLVTGIDYNRNDLETRNKFYTVLRSAGAKGEQILIAPFIHNELRLLDNRLITTLGGRYDWIKSSDGENWDTNPTPPPAYANEFPSHKWRKFSPKFGAVYHLDNTTTLKTSIGTGFKAPSLYELYTAYTRDALYIECNPQLQPEKVLSYDVGVEHSLLNNLLGKFTLYKSNARDYIDYYIVTPTKWVRDNITKVKIQGLETALDWDLSKEWSVLANYTYNQSKIMEYQADPTVEDNYLAMTPRNTYQLALSYKKPELQVRPALQGSRPETLQGRRKDSLSEGLEAKAILNYTGMRYDDNKNTRELNSYYTFNLNIARQFGKYGKLSLEVENLFDKEYMVYIYKGTNQDIISPGRVLNLSLKLDF